MFRICFCSQGCWNDFMPMHIGKNLLQLHPRPEALETPIDVEVENRQTRLVVAIHIKQK